MRAHSIPQLGSLPSRRYAELARNDNAAILACEKHGKRIMARWVAIFEDDETKATAIRGKYAQDHFAYLGANKHKILLAGGLRPEPGASFGGGLWILEVADRAEAMACVEGDPFYQKGLRKSARVYAWGKAFPEDVVTL